jgi:hypothetical protein
MKRFAHFLLLTVLCIAPVSAQAQELPITVRFGGISFAFDAAIGTSVNIYDDPGDALDDAPPNGAQPPHLEFLFYDDDNPPTLYQTDASLLVYGVSDVVEYENALEPIVYERFEALATLITDQRNLSVYEVAGSDWAVVLPHLPVILAPQVLRARVEYFETDTLKGIRYLTAYPGDTSRPLIAEDFGYSFIALSKSGALLFAGAFGVAPEAYWTTLPPEDAALMDDFYGNYGGTDAFEQGYMDYVAEQIALLDVLDADAFTPSLNGVDALMESIQIIPLG